MDYVKHPDFPSKDLDGRKVAVLESGCVHEGHFRVGKVRDDGFHELVVICGVVTQAPNSETWTMPVPMELPMNQASVNKIVVPEAASTLGQRGFQFVVVQDAKLEFLVKTVQR
ncbi:MAG: hypothetical protein ABSB84_03620 [Verrucomicrobiota bacterium]|jgi:hypothetical protein